jgi:hypothetical protein
MRHAEKELWDAWERSKQDKETSTKEKVLLAGNGRRGVSSPQGKPRKDWRQFYREAAFNLRLSAIRVTSPLRAKKAVTEYVG